MATFQYLARDATGGRVEGILESSDGAALADVLATNGLILVRASEVAQHATTRASWMAQLVSPKVTTEDLLLFFRQLSTLLKAGVPILRALHGLQESATSRRFGQVLSDLQQQLEGGRDLSTSMKRNEKMFSPYMVSMVHVGEVTGRLPEVLHGLFLQMSFERESREQAKAALRYPTFVIFTAIFALAAVNVFVIPSFAKVYKGLHAELPLYTSILIAVSDFFVLYWPLLLGLLATVAGALSYAMRTERGREIRDVLLLLLPVFGPLLRKAALARFTKSFGLAVNAGVPVVDALQVALETADNVVLSKRIRTMRSAAEHGDSLVRAARTTGVFTPTILQMIAVGEETGALGDMMNEVADFYQSDVEYAMKGLAAQIEPILILVLGGMVLIIALGVFLPMWNLGHVVLHR